MFGKGGDRNGATQGQPSSPTAGLRTDTSSHHRAATSHLGTDKNLDSGPRWSTASVSAPKGGGALKSIAEAFRANPATGSGTTSIPIAVTPARGLEPQLALAYDSGSGNGPFGHGWAVGLGQISRKTDKGLPRYMDETDSDTFVLSDAEDLVPALVEAPSGTWTADERTDGAYRVRRYRPRVEGGFARIERWTNQTTKAAHWRVRDGANVLRVYGQNAASRVADPARPGCVFAWLLDEVVDERGNRMVLVYDRDSAARGVSTAFYDVARRDGLSLFTQIYLRRIFYGNATPHSQGDTATDFLFQLVFDYGDLANRDGNAGETGGLATPTAELVPATNPPERADAFSTRRPGFEVRTRWRCERIVLFHAIDLAGSVLSPVTANGAWLPVSSWHLRYDATSHLAKLLGVARVGWRSRPGAADTVVTEALAMPEVTFGYTEPRLGTRTETLGAGDATPVPQAVEGRQWRFVDLDGEGLPGLLTEQGGGWWFKRNDGDPEPRAFANRPWFGPPTPLRTLPTASLLDGAALSDVDGDGRTEVVTRARGMAGTWSRAAGGWEAFRPFRRLPNVDWNDPTLRMVDLTGDGLADLVHLVNDALRWWPSRGLDGYARQVNGPARGRDEAQGPVFVTGTTKEAIFFADMTGDGLSDIVRVRATSVCYWPNLGYGRFGAQVHLANAPRLPPSTFDPSRLRLADVDGSGTTDLLYASVDGVILARNLSGNAFADLERVTATPPTLDHLDVVDLLGDGTACLVWSSGQQGTPRFIRLMADGKPHLLNRVDHGTGLVTTLEYAPSTRFYVDDRAAGRPWATRLPFPVQCLARVVTTDHAREHTLTSRYAYHHGFYDSVERAFRGFGRVDQWDSEVAGGDDVEPVIPVRRSTWLHTGAWFEQSTLEAAFAKEWFTGDVHAPTLEPNRVASSSTLTPAERREAARAMKGRTLREEVWRDDGTSPAAPYAVSQSTWEVRPLQPRRATVAADVGPWEKREDVPGVFHVVQRGTLTLAYDEQPSDPRVQHQLVLEVDAYGTPVRTAALAYPRRGVGRPVEQATPLVVVTQSDVVHDNTSTTRLRLAVPWQARRWEVGGLTFPSAGAAWTVAGLDAALAAVPTELGPHAPTPTSGAWRRLTGMEVLRYQDPSTGDPLDLGVVGTVALPYDVRALVMTTDLLAELDAHAGWSATERDAALTDEGRYVIGTSWADTSTLEDRAEAATESPEEAEALLASWWSPPENPVWASSGVTNFDAAHFFLPMTQTDPFGTTTTVTWDDVRLKPATVSVPVGDATHEVSATYDPHTLQPDEVTDINGSRTASAFDALGRVVRVANLGRVGETVDDLDHPTASFDYTFASFDAEEEIWTPASAHSATRRSHWFGTESTEFDEAWVYFDGMGRELLTKAKAAPDTATPSTPRFVGTGRILFDAKGSPVKQYEPYFSDTSDWEPDTTAAMQGVTPILRYDPLGRLVRTDHPDGTHERVERTPWQERHFDRNDTVPDVTFSGATPTTLADALTAFESGAATAPTSHPWMHARTTASISGVDGFLTVERGKALRRSAAQAWWVRDTPTVLHVDVLGRPFLEQRAKSSAKTDGAYTDTTDVHVTLDVLGRATRIAARYQGTSTRVEQLATADVFDLLGRSVQHVRRDAQTWNATTEEAEGGTTWTLSSVDGQPVRSWDSREHAFRRTFDALRRPVALFTKAGAGADVCSVFTRYGEQAGEDAQENRLYGQPWRVYDQSGRVTTEAVDVDGRVTSTTTIHVLRFDPLPDWTDTHDETDPAHFDDHDPDWRKVAHDTTVTTPDDEVFWHERAFDVAGRPTYEAEWRNSGGKAEKRYAYDAGGRLLGIDVRLRSTDPDDWRPKLGDVTYNARGQRLTARTGDDGETTPGLTMEATYTYDPETFRLLRSTTERLADEVVLDDYRWVHDAVGNVTFQEQAHSDTVWYDNAIVTPHRRYQYDALDRLVEASGREHDSTVDTSAGYAGSRRQTSRPYGLGAVAHRADGTALRTYTQRFTYDDVGNILELRHIQGGMSGETFVRDYAYETAGATDGSLFNNQVLHTTIGSTDYAHTYDAHGNTTSLSHLPEMAWDPFDRLHSVQTQARYPLVSHPGDPEAALSTPLRHDWFYLYDASGQRTRKVRAKLVGDPEAPDGESCWEERVYVGSFEVWRRYNADGTTETERETLHVMDDQRRVAMVETLTWEDGEEVGTPTPRWRFQLDDHLGTSVGEVTELGAEIGWEEYHPYGTTALSSFDSTREVSAKRYRYTGMERDDETGLAYHSARYYAPWLARWVSTDPLGTTVGLGTFSAMNSRPVTLTDRTGAAPLPPGGQPIETPEVKRWNDAVAAVGDGQSETHTIKLPTASGGRFSFKLQIDKPSYRAVELGAEEFDKRKPSPGATGFTVVEGGTTSSSTWWEKGGTISNLKIEIRQHLDITSYFREGSSPSGPLADNYGLGETVSGHEWEHARAEMQLAANLPALFDDAGWVITPATPADGPARETLTVGGASNIDALPFTPRTADEAEAATTDITSFISDSLYFADIQSTHYLEPGTLVTLPSGRVTSAPPRLDWSTLRQTRGEP